MPATAPYTCCAVACAASSSRSAPMAPSSPARPEWIMSLRSPSKPSTPAAPATPSSAASPRSSPRARGKLTRSRVPTSMPRFPRLAWARKRPSSPATGWKPHGASGRNHSSGAGSELGAGNDIVRATELARKMVCEYGMSDLGPLTYGKKEQEIFLGRDIAQSRDYSDDTAKQIDVAVRGFVDEAYRSAHKILEENADIMHRMRSEEHT